MKYRSAISVVLAAPVLALVVVAAVALASCGGDDRNTAYSSSLRNKAEGEITHEMRRIVENNEDVSDYAQQSSSCTADSKVIFTCHSFITVRVSSQCFRYVTKQRGSVDPDNGAMDWRNVDTKIRFVLCPTSLGSNF